MISVVICTYNRASSLAKTLESLRQMTVPPDLEWELIVVDNNSTDNTRAIISEFAQTSGLSARYVFEPKQGLCHARNTGVANASGEIIAFTDDDVQVSPGWLPEVVVTFTEFNCMGMGGRSIPAWNGLSRPDWLITTGPYRLQSGPILDFDQGDEAKELRAAPWGLNMAFRRSAFEKHGMFRTDLDPSGSDRLLGGDTEFGGRLMRAGEKIFYSPKAIVFHPVVQQRITKQYYLQHYFNSGRESIRQGFWPSETVLYFGIPRYIFRSFVVNCAMWFFAFRREKRFYYKAHAHRSLGEISEGMRLRRQRLATKTSQKADHCAFL